MRLEPHLKYLKGGSYYSLESQADIGRRILWLDTNGTPGNWHRWVGKALDLYPLPRDT